MQNRIIEIQNIYKSFAMPSGELNVLNGVDLEIYEGEFICLLGYSGCGKSTLLRIISQLEKQDKGKIVLYGNNYDKASKDVIMLFQDFNQLFPWLTVKKNIVFPGKKIGLYSSREEAEQKADLLLASVGLSNFKDSYPHQLSGGMKQRVSVARALSLEPKVLLMDEPFAALDATTRTHLQNLTRQICKERGVTVVFVTHNVEEAVLMGDRIVIMSSKTGTVDRIISNNREHSKENRAVLISEIIDILDNQIASH